MNPSRSLPEYEQFIYTLQQTYSCIVHSTLVVARRGRGVATLTGELLFADGLRLTVYEIVTWDMGPVLIQRYSYEVWRGSEKLTGTIRSPTPTTPFLPALSRITSIFHRT